MSTENSVVEFQAKIAFGIDYIWRCNGFIVLCYWDILPVLGKLLSGEEEGLEDDPERAEVTTGSFSGKSQSFFCKCIYYFIN